MRIYSASTIIAAPIETVWSILIDGGRWPLWDPLTERIEGTIAPGARVVAYSKLNPVNAFPVMVSVFEPPRRMVWRSALPLGLFSGERSYVLTPRGDDSTLFDLTEQFSGLLLPLFARVIPHMDAPFAQFAAGLKQQAERA